MWPVKSINERNIKLAMKNVEKTRNLTKVVKVGNVSIGGMNPIVVQSMTNTDTADVRGTVDQVKELVEAGSEIVRITVNTEKAAIAVPKIQEKLVKSGYDVPLVGDFHYNGHTLLTKHTDCAEVLSKYRINPGKDRKSVV